MKVIIIGSLRWCVGTWIKTLGKRLVNEPLEALGEKFRMDGGIRDRGKLFNAGCRDCYSNWERMALWSTAFYRPAEDVYMRLIYHDHKDEVVY